MQPSIYLYHHHSRAGDFFSIAEILLSYFRQPKREHVGGVALAVHRRSLIENQSRTRESVRERKGADLIVLGNIKSLVESKSRRATTGTRAAGKTEH